MNKVEKNESGINEKINIFLDEIKNEENGYVAIKKIEQFSSIVSNEYSDLRIETSVAQIDLPDGPSVPEDEIETIVVKYINKYLENNEFIIDPNEIENTTH